MSTRHTVYFNSFYYHLNLLLTTWCHDGGGRDHRCGWGCCVSCPMMVVAVYVIWAFSCALWHFRNLKEGSHCHCRNKIKTIGEKKRKERNCIEVQYRKKKKKNKLWASRRRICGANISKVKKAKAADSDERVST